ncbi:cupin domain-containing protein [Jidongwangia harbinensis]|uniref:cupin domain-containing protein n=1 Tax=Jidongwangia harbinensis TaxID=2878561 RepID=UPI001CD9D874|nr:cupin domain-containing protein [Jidongwangia harbinensis]MCA2219427.1 cupin domain-containing protein [Jidongwangia harbinensis]
MTALADGLLSHALSASSRRDIRTIDGGRPHLLYQSVIALARGQRIEEHDHPGEATVQVLRGRVRVTAGEDTTDVSTGQLVIVSGVRHSVTALEDAVVLLSVARRTTPTPADRMNLDLPDSYHRQRQRGHRRWPVNAPVP